MGPDDQTLHPGIQLVTEIPFQILGEDEAGAGQAFLLSNAGGNGLAAVVHAKQDGAINNGELPTGRSLFLLHRADAAETDTVGEILLTYKNGKTKTIYVTGKDFDTTYPDEKSIPLSFPVLVNDADTGFRVTKYDIELGQISAITITATDSLVWEVAAATVSYDKVYRHTRDAKPLEASPDWKPMTYSKDVEPGSALDFSCYLDAPAGKYGPVIAKGPHLYFQNRPETPVHFLGTNLCSGSMYLSHEWAIRLADRFASLGFNSVRMHHYDNSLTDLNNSTIIVPEQMEKWDFLVSEFKKRGIYVTIDIFVSRYVRRNEIPDLDYKIKTFDEYKALVWISDPVYENWKTFTRNLLTHVNPYTGLSIAEDPVYMSISLVNEDNIYNECHLTPGIEEMYNKKYDEWMAEKGLEKPEDELAAQVQFNTFLYDIYFKRYQQMTAYLKELGANQIITDQNHQINPFLQQMRNRYDYVDCHGYWAHPWFPNHDWNLPAKTHHESAIVEGGWLPWQLCASRLLDKPFFVTEFDFCRPNRKRAEGPILQAACACLQDWDAMYQFAYAHGEASVFEDGRTRHFMDLSTDPLKHLAYRVCALIFLNSNAKPASSTLAVTLSPDKMLPLAPGFPYNLGVAGRMIRVGTITSDKPLPEGTVAVVDFDGSYHGSGLPIIPADENICQALADKGIVQTGTYDRENGVVISENLQMKQNMKQETFSFSSDLCEALIMPEGHSLTSNLLSATVEKGRAVIALASCDKRPLKESARMLILHLTDIGPSNMYFSDEEQRMMETWGTTPFLGKFGISRITVKATPGDYRLFALNTAGQRINECGFTQDADGVISFTANTFEFEEPVMAYELVAE